LSYAKFASKSWSSDQGDVSNSIQEFKMNPRKKPFEKKNQQEKLKKKEFKKYRNR